MAITFKVFLIFEWHGKCSEYFDTKKLNQQLVL